MFSKIALTGILALAMATPAFNSAAAHTAYDGSWALTIMTKRGACDPTYNFQVQIANGIVSHPNLVKLRGRVSSGGGVRVSVAAGDKFAAGSGSLTRTSGRGHWSGHSGADRCSGSWTAQRNG